MKWSIILLSILIMQSCQITNLGKKDRHSLYINTTIPAYSSLVIWTENAKSFSFEALAKSNGNITLKTHDTELNMDQDNKYALNVDDSEHVKFTNSSNLTRVIKVKIFNHSAKVIQNIEQL